MREDWNLVPPTSIIPRPPTAQQWFVFDMRLVTDAVTKIKTKKNTILYLFKFCRKPVAYITKMMDFYASFSFPFPSPTPNGHATVCLRHAPHDRHAGGGRRGLDRPAGVPNRRVMAHSESAELQISFAQIHQCTQKKSHRKASAFSIIRIFGYFFGIKSLNCRSYTDTKLQAKKKLQKMAL